MFYCAKEDTMLIDNRSRGKCVISLSESELRELTSGLTLFNFATDGGYMLPADPDRKMLHMFKLDGDIVAVTVDTEERHTWLRNTDDLVAALLEPTTAIEVSSSVYEHIYRYRPMLAVFIKRKNAELL